MLPVRPKIAPPENSIQPEKTDFKNLPTEIHSIIFSKILEDKTKNYDFQSLSHLSRTNRYFNFEINNDPSVKLDNIFSQEARSGPPTGYVIRQIVIEDNLKSRFDDFVAQFPRPITPNLDTTIHEFNKNYKLILKKVSNKEHYKTFSTDVFPLQDHRSAIKSILDNLPNPFTDRKASEQAVTKINAELKNVLRIIEGKAPLIPRDGG